jgi:hypothetical protein
MKRRTIFQVGWLVAMLSVGWLLFSGCGYRFVGSGDLPPGITSVGVRTLENETSAIGLENQLTNDLVFELTRAGRLPVVRPEEASAVMSGTIETLRVRNLSRSSINTAQEQRVTLSVRFVVKNKAGETIWRRKLSESEEYLVGTDTFSTGANRNQALQTVTRRLAEKAHYGLTDQF